MIAERKVYWAITIIGAAFLVVGLILLWKGL